MKSIGVGVVLVGAVVMLPGSGWAQCPLPAPVAFNEATVVAIPDGVATCAPGTAVDRTINVAGQPTFLTDLNVRLNVVHQFPPDIQITITSPQGTIVSLATNPNTSFDNLLAGTTFDDDADPAGGVPYAFNNRLVTDIDPAISATPPFLVPEEALGAFYAENPNGTWTLRIVDTCAADVGTLNSWGLDIAALSSPPTEASTTVAVTGGAIPDPGVLVSNAAVDATALGIGTFLTDIEVLTSIVHPEPFTLQFALRSPSGTVVTLSTNNGVGLNDFNPTLWDDQADPDGLVPHASVGGNPGVASDHPYSGFPASPLVPEEAMGAFYGEDPDGTWTLFVADTNPPPPISAGTLSNWNLVLTTGTCAGPTPTPTRTPTPTVTPGGPTVTPGGPTVTPIPGVPTPTPTIPPVVCNGLPATIVGTTGNDLIIGTSADDVIHALGGSDIVKGRRGSDQICGGGGDDVLRGNKDDDLIRGGSGNDEVRGGGGRDVLLGGKDNDFHDGGDDATGDENDTCIDRKGSNAFVNCENVQQ